MQDGEAPAFGRPGGEDCKAAAGRPIDLVHLSRQTFGDRALEAEILGMFVQQLGGVCDELRAGDKHQRARAAHALVGSARGIGAFPLAECAAEIEAHPASDALLERLARRIDEVRDFIAAINR